MCVCFQPLKAPLSSNHHHPLFYRTFRALNEASLALMVPVPSILEDGQDHNLVSVVVDETQWNTRSLTLVAFFVVINPLRDPWDERYIYIYIHRLHFLVDYLMGSVDKYVIHAIHGSYWESEFVGFTLLVMITYPFPSQHRVNDFLAFPRLDMLGKPGD